MKWPWGWMAGLVGAALSGAGLAAVVLGQSGGGAAIAPAPAPASASSTASKPDWFDETAQDRATPEKLNVALGQMRTNAENELTRVIKPEVAAKLTEGQRAALLSMTVGLGSLEKRAPNFLAAVNAGDHDRTLSLMEGYISRNLEPNPSFADADESFSRCLNGISNTTLADPLADIGPTENCDRAEYARVRALLDNAYAKLDAAVEPEDRPKLLEAQEAWLKSRDADCRFTSANFSSGEDRRTAIAECYISTTKTRTNALSNVRSYVEGR